MANARTPKHPLVLKIPPNSSKWRKPSADQLGNIHPVFYEAPKTSVASHFPVRRRCASRWVRFIYSKPVTFQTLSDQTLGWSPLQPDWFRVTFFTHSTIPKKVTKKKKTHNCQPRRDFPFFGRSFFCLGKFLGSVGSVFLLQKSKAANHHLDNFVVQRPGPLNHLRQTTPVNLTFITPGVISNRV